MRVKPFEAVRVWVEVKDPLLVVVTPVLPIDREVALVLPIFIAPAESKTRVPEVTVEIVKFPDVFVQADVPPDARTNAPVELPILVPEVPVALMLVVPVTVSPPVP